jgi:S-adenosyl methyltransferase
MREYVDALPSGSYVAVSHLFDPGEGGDHETMAAFQEAVAKGSLGGATARTESEIRELLPGLELVEPGIVLLANWWSDGPSLTPLNSAQRRSGTGLAAAQLEPRLTSEPLLLVSAASFLVRF